MRAARTRENGTVSFLIENGDARMHQQIKTALESEYLNARVLVIDHYCDSLDILIHSRPDIFIVDIDSNHIGTQIIRLANILNIHTNVIVTGDNNVHTIDACISMGVKGYVMKPIDNRLFIKTVNQILEDMQNESAA